MKVAVNAEPEPFYVGPIHDPNTCDDNRIIIRTRRIIILQSLSSQPGDTVIPLTEANFADILGGINQSVVVTDKTVTIHNYRF